MYRLALLLAPMVLALPFAMDIYVPAVPKIAGLFHVNAAGMQLTLSLFMLTAGFAQLWVGKFSDSVGRKKSALIVISIFALGTLLCAYATSLNQLIAFRIIQALGSCGMLVIGFGIVRDLYVGREGAVLYGILNGIIAFSPMFAPFIGAYLDIHYGWPSTFLGLLFIAIAAYLCFGLFIKESLPLEKRTTMKISFWKTYWPIAKNRTFATYTLATAMGLSYLYLFCALSSFIIIRALHIDEAKYGYYFAFMGVSFFLGSILAASIVKRLGIFKTVSLGFVITLIGGSMMLVWHLITGLTINNFIWPMLLIGIGGTLCMGAGNAGAMQPMGDRAGSASALSGGFRFVFSGLLGMLVIGSEVHSTLPLAIPAITMSILGLAVHLRFNRDVG